MKILVNQYFGLGDVIFCMTIARRWIAEGHSITWPVLPQFVDGLQRAYPDVTFINWKEIGVNYERRDEHDWNGYRVVPLRWNVEIMNVPYHRCMESKYTMFAYDWREWREKAMWERDEKRERALMEQLEIMTEYNAINDTFGSDSSIRVHIPLNKNRPNYLMQMPGYSLFDWAKILENATEIHTVSTSIIYILELLDIKCPIHIYKREPIERDHKNYDYILQSHNYILH